MVDGRLLAGLSEHELPLATYSTLSARAEVCCHTATDRRVLQPTRQRATGGVYTRVLGERRTPPRDWRRGHYPPALPSFRGSWGDFAPVRFPLLGLGSELRRARDHIRAMHVREPLKVYGVQEMPHLQ